MSTTRSEAARPGNGTLARFSLVCILIYIAFYTLESPTRYVLYLTGLSTLILLRDGLIMLPLALIILRDLLGARVQPAIWAFGLCACIGFVIGYLNFGQLAPVALGTKMLFNTVFGLIAGRCLIDTGPRVNKLFIALWVITVAGVVLEKYVVTFPWVGLHALVGNVDVEISRDWQITDAFDRRVGGFTKVSISAAGLMPLLCIVAASRVKSAVTRNAMFAITAAGVFMTTQKGALLAMLVVWGASAVPSAMRMPVQVVVAIFGVLLDVALPFLTNGMNMAQGSGGSYSASSFVQRIVTTWPDSLVWIERQQIFPFGVGLGGIGEAQRFVASGAFHYPDNMFLFLYSSFGVFGILFMAAMIWAALRAPGLDRQIASCALSVLTFIVVYGTFVSIIEDQMEALFLGVSVGVLLSRTQEVPSATVQRSRPVLRAAEAI